MNRGGVETWLLNVLRRVPREEVAIDLMVHTSDRAAYDAEAEALGVVIHRNVRTRHPVWYGMGLRGVLSRAHGYDIVHSHVHHYSGVALSAAMLAGVPVRIAHSHNDTRTVDAQVSPWRRTYLRVAKQLIQATATDGFACSDDAAHALFGDGWRDDGRWRLLSYGIDLAAYSPIEARERQRVRADVGIPSEAPVVVHVGRFEPQKNHAFLLDVFAAVLQRRPDAMLALLGTGPLVEATARRAVTTGVRENVRFCGSRSDVARVLGAADVFVFPSHYEGFGVACLEAQAAGLPVVMSDALPPEVAVAPEGIARLPLGATQQWADALIESFDMPRRWQPPSLRGTPFDIAVSARTLVDSYRDALDRHRMRRRTVGARRQLEVGVRPHVRD